MKKIIAIVLGLSLFAQSYAKDGYAKDTNSNAVNDKNKSTMIVTPVYPYPVDNNGNYVPYNFTVDLTRYNGAPCRDPNAPENVDQGETDGLPDCPPLELYIPNCPGSMFFCENQNPPNDGIEGGGDNGNNNHNNDKKKPDLEPTLAAAGINGYVELSDGSGVNDFPKTELTGQVTLTRNGNEIPDTQTFAVSWHIVQGNNAPTAANRITPGFSESIYEWSFAESDVATVSIHDTLPIAKSLFVEGEDNYIVLVIDGGNSNHNTGVLQGFAEEREGNNEYRGQRITTNPGVLPDFVISEGTLQPYEVRIGERLNLTARVKNIGGFFTPMGSPKPLKVKFTARRVVAPGTDPLSGQLVQLGSRTLNVYLSSLTGNESPQYTHSKLVTAAQLPPGDYDVNAIVDPANQYAEADITNNEISLGRLKVEPSFEIPFPDLIIADASATISSGPSTGVNIFSNFASPTLVDLDTHIDFASLVLNQGPAATPSGKAIEVQYWAREVKPGSFNFRLASATTPGPLNANTIGTYSFPASTILADDDENFEPGKIYELKAVVDPASVEHLFGVIIEGNEPESNNDDVIGRIQINAMDVKIEAANCEASGTPFYPAEITPTDEIAYSCFTVTNLSTFAINRQLLVELYYFPAELGSLNNPNPNTTLRVSDYFDYDLAPGASITREVGMRFRYAYPEHLLDPGPKSFKIQINVQPDGSAFPGRDELNYENNVDTVNYGFNLFGSDLELVGNPGCSAYRSTDLLFPDLTVVYFDVKNTGNLTAAATTGLFSLLNATNTGTGNTGASHERFIIPSLAGGESKRVYLYFDNTVLTNTSTYAMRVDDIDAVPEIGTGELNNHTSNPLHYSPAPADAPPIPGG